ncbi:MAG TPA: type II toxin-antitoxin system VapC family toxin [Thermoanaerobaculia bacterium]|nr:type II toxin-antitoxin system VapC family toxin [Thermoanaerobaculia bacterium]
MKAYIDSSVLIRIAFRSPTPLAVWDEIDYYVSSVLLRLECARALQRLRFDNKYSVTQIIERRAAVALLTADMDLVEIREDIFDLAAGAFAAPLKTLDAIHLATAIALRDQNHLNLAFATHDDMLARAARAAGFEVLGA